METRVGIGYDIHRLVEGRKLIIGGVQIPYIRGLLGHTDADVLLHAITDALLGAIGGSDIGELFPDTDPRYRDADSSLLLKEVLSMAGKKGYAIINVDTIIIAEEPKLSSFKHLIQRKVAGILEIVPECVNIKAKTNEGLGDLGQKKAIAVFASVSIGRGDGK